MSKIGMIGDRDAILGFMALGFSVHEISSAEQGAKLLHTLVRSGEYSILFITENYAKELEDEISKYKDLPLPAIISLPGREGSTGYGMNLIKNAVERAVGADILFKD